MTIEQKLSMVLSCKGISQSELARRSPFCEKIKTAIRYFRELIETGRYTGSEVEARQIGATLSAALSNIQRD